MLLESCLLHYESRIQIEMTYLDIRLQCITEFGELRRYTVASCINRILFGYVNIHLFAAWSLISSILIWVELKSIYLIYPNALSVVDTK